MRNQIAFIMSIVLLAILFVMLAVLAGWLFSMGGLDEADSPQPAVTMHLGGNTTGTVDLALAAEGEDLLRVDDYTIDYPPRGPRPPVLPASSNILGGGAFGELPMLCPQSGPQIQEQRDYRSPILHDAFADPSRVVFQLDEPTQYDSPDDEEAQP
jgi:hypothetical protein